MDATDKGVKWPGRAVDSTGDLSAPIQSLLVALGVLGKQDDLEKVNQFRWDTPPSLQVINAGATSLTKWVATLIGAVGGLSAVGAYIAGFWQVSDEALRIVSLSVATALVGILAIAVALVVRADVSARATAAAAEYGARAAIADAFLRTCPRAPETRRYGVKKKGSDTPMAVERFEVEDGVLIVVTASDRIPSSEIENLYSTPTLFA